MISFHCILQVKVHGVKSLSDLVNDSESMYHTFPTLRMFFIDKSSMTLNVNESVHLRCYSVYYILIRGCLSCFLSLILSAKPQGLIQGGGLGG